MPVGIGVAMPTAAYVRHIFMRMYPEERENMGLKSFATTILVFRTVAECAGNSKGVISLVRPLLREQNLDPTASDFDVIHFIQLVKDRL